MKDENRPTFEIRLVLQVNPKVGDTRLTIFGASPKLGEWRINSWVFPGRAPSAADMELIQAELFEAFSAEILSRMGIQGVLRP
jgi:hypothetical protein